MEVVNGYKLITPYVVKRTDCDNGNGIVELSQNIERFMPAVIVAMGFRPNSGMVNMNTKVGILPFPDLVKSGNGVVMATTTVTISLSLG